MIVVRRTYLAKRGCTRELAEALKSYPEYGLPELPHGWRVYWSNGFGPSDVVIWEAEFESLAEQQAWHKELVAAPFREWMDLRRDLHDRGGGTEVWNVELCG